MKRTVSLLRTGSTVALVSLFVLAACGGEKSATIEKNLPEKLAALNANTPDKPHTVRLDATVNISAKWDFIREALINEGKYVILDLSACGVNDGIIPSVSGNRYLKGVILPNVTTAIADRAFRGCESLVSISIPAGVTSIGNGAFANCSSLTTITVASGNATYKSIDGVLFDKAATALLWYPRGKGGNYTLPKTVTTIPDGAFSGGLLTGIVIPEGVTAIGTDFFNGSKSLASVTLPASIASIGYGAFNGCESLAAITLPAGVASIGDRAFLGCAALSSVTIPAKVTSIGYGAFWNCSGLSSVTFEVEGCAISRGSDWSIGGAFPGDLRAKYVSGGAGTYTRQAGASTWTKN